MLTISMIFMALVVFVVVSNIYSNSRQDSLRNVLAHKQIRISASNRLFINDSGIVTFIPAIVSRPRQVVYLPIAITVIA